MLEIKFPKFNQMENAMGFGSDIIQRQKLKILKDPDLSILHAFLKRKIGFDLLIKTFLRNH